jgi:hypothetical protein
MRAGLATGVAAFAIAVLPLSAASQAEPPVKATLAQLSWLAGVWTGSAGPARFEERWTPAGGGAMLAVSRTITGDRMVAFEFLRIVEREGTLIYIAQPNGRPPTEFRLSTIAANTVSFENPSHDFPKLIVYSLKADDTLEARVSDGGRKGEVFVFRKAK